MIVETPAELPVLGVLPPEWRVVPFGSILQGGVRNGIYKPKAFHGTGDKIVNMGELFANPRLFAVPMKRLTLTMGERQRFSLQAGDLLFARRSLVAEGAGKCTIVCEVSEPTTFESSIIRARPDPQSADSRYLYYLFRSPYGTYILDTIRRQVAVAGITGNDLEGLPIPLPPLREQRAIASILGSLDDKIELNRQMNATLEAMAQALFKSWFVDFDPVRAKAEGRQPAGMDDDTAALFPDAFEDSPLGEIPEGWELCALGEAVGINERSITGTYSHQLVSYVDISSVSEGRLESTTTYTLRDAPSRARRLVQHGDTIWSTVRPNRRSFLYIDHPAPDLVVSTGFAVLTPHIVPPAYLYAWVTTDDFVAYLTRNADGAAYPAVRPDRFASAPLLLPPSQLLAILEHRVGGLRERVAHNERESQTLATIRDTLLPKLLSGELRVKEAKGLVEVVL